MHDNVRRALSYTPVHRVIRAGGGEEEDVGGQVPPYPGRMWSVDKVVVILW